MNIRTTFTGHIIERLRPDGFPKTVSCFVEASDITPADFADLVNTTATNIVKTRVMLVPRLDEQKPVVGNPSFLAEFDRNWIIPLDMISHITMQTVAFPDVQEAEKVKIN